MPAAASKKTQCSSETVPVEVLLLSADVGTIEDLRHYMDQALMNVEVCSNAASVIHKLGRSRFDGFALDLRESKAGLELLLKVHNTRHCRRSVLLAILDKTTMQSEAGDVFRCGRFHPGTTILFGRCRADTPDSVPADVAGEAALFPIFRAHAGRGAFAFGFGIGSFHKP
jgi:hypothetical protein